MTTFEQEALINRAINAHFRHAKRSGTLVEIPDRKRCEVLEVDDKWYCTLRNNSGVIACYRVCRVCDIWVLKLLPHRWPAEIGA
ncbi:hypothetical protein J8I88_18925 (plasmid) [Duffyella gerundensis]|uniref:hypothetical protein n=1 Tax=Duffyella gerundensis TaxID=1619313 RepID=UPI001690D5E0|nr:hypothetical protein [Duffyella gerundensis]QTO56539.1 hypothetical protein J8I88_18925 [Duffyella gerundensis]